MTVAKGLGGGIPIGAVIGLGTAGHLFEPGNHGTTFGGNPVACAAGLAVIETIEKDGLLEHAAVLGAHLREGLAADPRVTEVRGAGLLIGLSLAAPRSADVVAAAQAHGFSSTPRRPTGCASRHPWCSRARMPTGSSPPGRASSTTPFSTTSARSTVTRHFLADDDLSPPSRPRCSTWPCA